MKGGVGSPEDVWDKSYSWVVAVAACVVYFIMNGLSRATGLLFVETLVFFDTDRETASFPFILACALRYVSGPVAGALAGRLGLRLIILLGSIMACIGIGGCFLATTITAMSFLFGGVFGLGSGISSSQLPQVNNLYFTKHLTTANGISYAGSAIAGFVLPPIMEKLLSEYGMPGTYLILSAIALHAIPAAILLKEPEWEKLPMISFEIPEEIKENYRRRFSSVGYIYDNTRHRARRLSQRLNSVIFSERTTFTINEDNTEMGISQNPNIYSTAKKSTCLLNNFRQKSNSISFSENILQNTNASRRLVNDNIQNMMSFKTNNITSLSQIKGGTLDIKNTVIITNEMLIDCPERRSSKGKSRSFSQPEINVKNLQIPKDVRTINFQTIAPTVTKSLSKTKENEPIETKDIRRTCDSSENQFSIISRHAPICSRSSFENGNNSGSFPNSESNDKVGVCHIECTKVTEEQEQPPNMCLNDISIFFNMKFLLISFTGSINGFHCFVLPTILIDFCIDKGISTANATYIVMAFAICDMVGTAAFGWVTDRKYITRANCCAVCFFIMTASLAFFVWSTGLIPMFFVLSAFGLSLGVHTPLPPGLISEYIETSKHTMANASFNVLGVPLLLLTPTMIGYFRDGLGSYDLFVYLLSLISFVCGLMMLLLPYIHRREQEKKLTVLK